jgi:hypothetical protein
MKGMKTGIAKSPDKKKATKARAMDDMEATPTTVKAEMVDLS